MIFLRGRSRNVNYSPFSKFPSWEKRWIIFGNEDQMKIVGFDSGHVFFFIVIIFLIFSYIIALYYNHNISVFTPQFCKQIFIFIVNTWLRLFWNLKLQEMELSCSKNVLILQNLYL